MFFNQITIYAQNVSNRNINATPDGVLDQVFDSRGVKYDMIDLVLDKPSNTTFANVGCSTTSYFNLYYEPGCGLEDSNNLLHMQRRAVLCKVFEDVSNFIVSPLSSSTTKINIWVRNINNVYTDPNGILGLASGYYVLPNDLSSGGIIDNEIWKTIHTGKDSYLNLTVPLTSAGGSSNQLGMFFHGMVTFNFNDTATPPIANTNTINWNTNLTTQNIAFNEFDLYSVALHEITHALGFGSLINSDGNSVFGTNYKYYNRYDRFLKSNNGANLLTSTACSSMYDYGFDNNLSVNILHPNTQNCLANFTNCTNAIKFVGTNTVPVYTPNCFNEISSLSHFEDMHYPICNTPNGNDNYFLMCNNGNSGMIRRYLKPEERNALCDIGYKVKTTFGANTTYNGFYNYGGTSCNGIVVAGTNDGINLDGSPTFLINANQTLNITANGFLNNDTNATGYECLQDLTANATFPTQLTGLSGTATTPVTFRSALDGWHLLRYVPTNGTQKGNITYVYVFVNRVVASPACNATPNACNMVVNGDFEKNNSYLTVPANNQFNRLCNWSIAGNQDPTYMYAKTTDLSRTVPCNSFGFQNDKILNNKGYVRLRNSQVGNIFKKADIISTILTTPILPNTTYQLNFDVSIAERDMFKFMQFQAFISNESPSSITGVQITDAIIDNGFLYSSPTFSSDQNGWETISITFTTPNNINNNLRHLYLGGLNNFLTIEGRPFKPNPCASITCYGGCQTATYYLDNVSLIQTSGATINLPDEVCYNTLPFTNLASLLVGAPPNGVFSGSGISNSNGNYTFDPAIANVGNNVINYTYQNGGGCQVTISRNIVVNGRANCQWTCDS